MSEEAEKALNRRKANSRSWGSVTLEDYGASKSVLVAGFHVEQNPEGLDASTLAARVGERDPQFVEDVYSKQSMGWLYLMWGDSYAVPDALKQYCVSDVNGVNEYNTTLVPPGVISQLPDLTYNGK